MKYKVGDKVRVREDLEVYKLYGREAFTSEMVPLKGKIVTISKVVGYRCEIEEDLFKYWWADEMFSGKVSEDFIPEEPISQNRLPERENFSDIITIKITKAKLLLL